MYGCRVLDEWENTYIAKYNWDSFNFNSSLPSAVYMRQ